MKPSVPLSRLKKELNDRKNQIQTGTSWIENEKNNIRTLHLRITEKMKWNDWNESWKQDPDSLIRKLKDETTDYRQAQEQLKAVTSRIELEQKELEAVLSAQETLLTLFPGWESDEKVIPSKARLSGKKLEQIMHPGQWHPAPTAQQRNRTKKGRKLSAGFLSASSGSE